MNYEELKEWIKNKMKPQDHRNYQPIMIKTLNQNNGEVTKEKIQKELHKANPDLPPEHFDKLPFKILEKNDVVELRIQALDSKDNLYVLNAFKTYGDNPSKVDTITMYCEQKIGVSKDIATLRGLENAVGKT